MVFSNKVEVYLIIIQKFVKVSSLSLEVNIHSCYFAYILSRDASQAAPPYPQWKQFHIFYKKRKICQNIS
jgi:hypothetical protein